jgi:hypothetical protein
LSNPGHCVARFYLRRRKLEAANNIHPTLSPNETVDHIPVIHFMIAVVAEMSDPNPLHDSTLAEKIC